MTAITPAYAHAYQTICLAITHFWRPVTTLSVFPNPSPDILLPSDRSITKELGHDYHGWAVYTDGGTRVVDGETLTGWGVISRSPHGRIYVMFGPVVTTEAHLALPLVPEHTPTTLLK